MIIGVVYTLSISGFKKASDESSKLSLLNLKEYLKSKEYTKNSKLICLGDCSECDIYIDEVKTDSIESFLDKNVKIYRYEFLYGFTESQKDVFFNENDAEEDVCFSYKVDKEGIGEQVLVEYKKKYYDLSSYFDDVAVYNSIQEATEAREKNQRVVMQ